MKDRLLGREGYIHHILLGLTLLLISVQPIGTNAGELYSRIVYGLVLVGSVAAVYGRRLFFLVGVALGAPSLVYFVLWPEGVWGTAGMALGVATLSFVCLVLLKGIYERPVVSSASVMSSLTVYLLFGIIWSLAFALVEASVPGSFYGLAGASAADTRRELFYYSFVTLTTLGYGDIGPSGQGARALAILESVVGQLYLVVLVASLVGMFLNQKAEQRAGASRE